MVVELAKMLVHIVIGAVFITLGVILMCYSFLYPMSLCEFFALEVVAFINIIGGLKTLAKGA